MGIQSSEATNNRVLIVEDDKETRLALTDALRDMGHCVVAIDSAEGAIEQTHQEEFGAVLSDIRMGGMDGLELCHRLTREGPLVPVVVMTAFGDVASARAALRAGAFDFLTKPFTLDQVAASLERALKHRASLRGRRLPLPPLQEAALSELIGSSSAMMAVREAVRFAAPTDSTVLLTGESGTGKELVARAIHQASHRSQGPFVGVSCAALPEAMVEAEFFGHARGAYTGATHARAGLLAQANGGTLFLDEIGDMPLELQPKLLRTLQQRVARAVGSSQESALDVRVVAATNSNLDLKVHTGEFREDLFYRVNTLRIQLPPLRDRGLDVITLARHFLEKGESEWGFRCEMTPRAEALLASYAWPGNVRQLENCICAAAAMCSANVIDVADLESHMGQSILSDGESASLQQVERRHIAQVLASVSWNKALAARMLGIDRATLYRKMRRFALNQKH